MAGSIVHLSQAKHNEEVATKLAQDPPYHDWGITAAFYAAIHYLEYWLFYREEKHTETSIPLNADGQFKYTSHVWREKIAEKKLSKGGFINFRKLRNASQTARYLSISRYNPGKEPQWLNKQASDFFTPDDARNLVEKSLQPLKIEFGIKILKK